MRIWYVSIALVWAAVAASTTTSSAQDEFPYTAYVLANDVYVRSGPGRDYYPTQKLGQGDPVEVYRHDPGGWLAIRPPEGSFTWVSSRYVEPTEGGLGKVTEEDTVARVGSQFSTVRDVIQVRLEKGELVEILEAANNGGQTWYKIAPPSGEFRWISAQYVDRRPPGDGVSEPRSEQLGRDDRVIGEAQSAAAVSAAMNDSPVAAARSSVAIPTEAEASRVGFSEGDAGPAVASDAAPRSTAPSTVRTTSAEAPIQIPGAPGAAAGAVSLTAPIETSDDLLAQLDVLELELSGMAAEEPTVWRFDDLVERAQLLLGQASSAIERGRVRRVLHRIDRLEDIKSRYDRIVGVQADTDLVNRSLDAALAASSSQAAATAPAPAEQFDATGLLRPVVSQRASAPHYAVVDEQGNVTAFLSPGPDVNLQPYLGRRIGVLGVRSYIPEYRRAHVMVSRITPLDVDRR